MLKKWSIENFKSFKDRTEIDLAPITIFAGANSSGKSTIIQSILLLKQTVQYAPINRPIALNGPLLKLGTFNDIKNASSQNKTIGIGFQIEVENLTQYYRSTPMNLWALPYFGEPTVNLINAQFKWDVPQNAVKNSDSGKESGRELLQLQPHLSSVRVDLTLKDEKKTKSFIELRRTASPQAGLGQPMPFDVKDIDHETAAEISQNRPDSQIAGAATRHFLPAQIGVRYDAAKQRAKLLAALICGEETFYSWGAREAGQSPISLSTAKKIEKKLVGEDTASDHLELFPRDESPEITIQRLATLYKSMRTRKRLAREPSPPLDLADLRQEIEQILLEDESPKIALDATITRAIGEAANYVHQFFVASVRYLGPLRDEPKPIYPLEALANPTEVGYKGEHTAAVLDLHRDRRIQYIPSEFIVNNKFDTKTKTASLHDAVVDWLKYVGVASEVTTADSGKFGHQLQVQTEGLSQYHDLTNVGVGVSQVLPIIVMALLAERPSFLIFEQPELHLHPKVQARLADFFLSVSLNGKQCLLETHSEYLIERFRRRVAEATDDSLTNMLGIYFTERSSGTTMCRQVSVSKYGAIADWPRDFFDQSQIETELILQAARTKRQSEKRDRS